MFLLAFPLQIVAMGFDEFYFHRKRELPLWERIGHPIDTVLVLGCFLIVLFLPYTETNLRWYGTLAIFSMLSVTKDEFIHAEVCRPAEHWLHAVLFLLHPIVLISAALTWPALQISRNPGWIRMAFLAQCALTFLFLIYQVIYWNFVRKRDRPAIDNSLYHSLGDRWYLAQDDPVALLRAESRLRNPWILRELERLKPGSKCTVLDIGCGAGFLSNELARSGHHVHGIDSSEPSLEVARRYDDTGRANYRTCCATSLPFATETFDAVCAMDFLEHVEDPGKVVEEASRVLKPGGLFFFHTFNRNPVAWLVVIKGVEFFVKNTPKHMHVLNLFLKPRELERICRRHQLEFKQLQGCRPALTSAFFRMLFNREVPRDFRFKFTPSTLISYTGVAVKRASV